jgi:hypothetical protein
LSALVQLPLAFARWLDDRGTGETERDVLIEETKAGRIYLLYYILRGIKIVLDIFIRLTTLYLIN